MKNTGKTSHKLQQPQQLIQVLPLTAEEVAINADRATRKFAPYVKVCCAKCAAVSPFQTRDELAVSRWKTIFMPGETVEILCPTHNA